MKTDSLFYRLFQRLPSLVLELAGLDFPAEGYEFRSEEIKQTAFRLDGVLVPPRLGPQRPTLFIEVQFQPDSGFYLRFFGEIFLYLRQNPSVQDWHAVIIFPERGIDSNAPAPLDYLLSWPLLHRIYLEDFRARVAESPTDPLSLIDLIVCDENEVLAVARRLLPHPPAVAGPTLSLPEWRDFIETILVYKLPRMSREEIQRMIGLQDIELKQTRFYQDVFAEGREEGIEAGREEGIEAGREEGRRLGELSLVRRLLSRRLGALSDEQEQRVRQLSIEGLESLGEALLEFTKPRDLVDWLDAHGGSGQ